MLYSIHSGKAMPMMSATGTAIYFVFAFIQCYRILSRMRYPKTDLMKKNFSSESTPIFKKKQGTWLRRCHSNADSNGFLEQSPTVRNVWLNHLRDEQNIKTFFWSLLVLLMNSAKTIVSLRRNVWLQCLLSVVPHYLGLTASMPRTHALSMCMPVQSGNMELYE